MRTAMAAAMIDSGRSRNATPRRRRRGIPTSWATRIQSGIESVVTPNRAITESGATLTVGRRAFSESGAPTMNGSHATAATAAHARIGARQSRRCRCQRQREEDDAPWLAGDADADRQGGGERTAGTDLVQRDDGAVSVHRVVEVPVAAELGPRERRQAATEEDEQLEVGVAANARERELVQSDAERCRAPRRRSPPARNRRGV